MTIIGDVNKEKNDEVRVLKHDIILKDGRRKVWVKKNSSKK